MSPISRKINSTLGVAIGSGIIILIVLIISFFSFGSFPMDTHSSVALLPTGMDTYGNNSVKTYSPAPQQTYDGWNSYSSDIYTVRYPSGWMIDKIQKDKSIIIKPKSSDSDSISSFSITVADAIAATSGAKESIQVDYGFTKSTITLNNSSFIKVSGTISNKSSNGDSVFTQKTMVYGQKGAYFYTLQYQYPANKQIPTTEELFANMLQTFHAM